MLYHLQKAVEDKKLMWVEFSWNFSYGNLSRKAQTLAIISSYENILSHQLKKKLDLEPIS